MTLSCPEAALARRANLPTEARWAHLRGAACGHPKCDAAQAEGGEGK